VISLLVIAARQKRYLLMGWLWYLGTLVPVIGLVQVGIQALADRYTYIPLIGLFIIIAWGAADLLGIGSLRNRPYRRIAGFLAAVVLIAAIICTQKQVRYWRDSITLFEHALELNPRNRAIHNNIGYTLENQGKLDEAAGHYIQALKVNPNHFEAHYNLANILRKKKRLDEAVLHYNLALKLRKNYAQAHNNLGLTLQDQGKFHEAIDHYRQALQIKTSFPQAHVNWGNILLDQHKFAEAVSHYRSALQLKANYATAYHNLGLAFQAQRKFDEAIKNFHRVLQIKPDFLAAYKALADISSDLDKTDQAIGYYRQALQIKPDWLGGLNDAAWLVATGPDQKPTVVDEAVRWATRAAELTQYEDITILDTLAAAYAAAGNFEKAVKTVQAAVKRAPIEKNDDLADDIRRRLKLYQQRKIYNKGVFGTKTGWYTTPPNKFEGATHGLLQMAE